jgi:hypothetical protein
MRLPRRRYSVDPNIDDSTRDAEPVDPEFDRYAITPAQVKTLAAQVRDPLTHTERCVDQFSFLPSGGHRLTRKLQILIPQSAAPPGRSMRIVSLGVFQPRRYPDFTVSDCAGRRLNLLTRRQHGLARTEVLLSSHVWKFSEQLRDHQRADPHSPTTTAYGELYASLFVMFTTINGESDEARLAGERACMAYVQLLRLLGLRLGAELYERLQAFGADLRQTVRATEYLCWAMVEPGEVINLSVTHTTKDILHDLTPLKGLIDAAGSIWRGAIEEPREQRLGIQAKWYVGYGLAPIKYKLAVTGAHRSRSYYYTVEPPEKADVTYLDWETGNSIEDAGLETDSAVPALHLHNHIPPADASSATGNVIRTYVRCAPSEHKKLAAGAFLNAVFVFLIAYGHLHGGLSQEWLLATPTVLLAYLAQQQRHYYAHTTRRQRAVVWGYLMACVLFLATIAFNGVSYSAGSRGWGWFTLVVAWLFAVSSVGLFVWYAPLGYSFQRITERKTHRAAEQDAALGLSGVETWRIYDRVVHDYCDRIMRCVAAGVVLTTVVAALTWHLPTKHGDTHAALRTRSPSAALRLPSACRARCRAPAARAG